MYNFSTEYWDKQQEELQNKWRKERERGVPPLSYPCDDEGGSGKKTKIKN